MVDLNVNRPVYLAQRDKSYLKAMDCLADNISEYSVEERYRKIDMTIRLFVTTKKSALLAIRGLDFYPDEVNFLKCLDLIIESLESAIIMVRHESLLEQDKSFLNQFLQESLSSVDDDENSVREISMQIINSTRFLVEKINSRFEKLRSEIIVDLSDDHKKRYDQMFNGDD